MKFFFVFFFALTSCGYHFENQSERCVSIPCVKGDQDGKITSQLIHAIATSGSFSYQNHSADYILQVEVLRCDYETIGWRKDRRKDATERKNITASEERKWIEAKVSILKKDTNTPFLGPFYIRSFVDYDFVDSDSLQDLSFIDQQNQRQTSLSFSLGQLVSVQSARDAANNALYKALSQKIVDVILSEW